MKHQEWTAGSLLEISGGYWQTCALHAAVKLDVFTGLDAGAATAEELAQALDVDARALGMLLNALAAMGLLAKTECGFSCNPGIASLLSKRSPAYVGHIIMHHQHLVSAWSMLDEAVKTGTPRGGRVVDTGDEQRRESFLMGMFNLAMGIAPGLARQIDLGGRRKLLDLGGGPGTYAIQFCLANPELSGEVLDLATTKPFAESTIARFGLADRVRFASCDYLSEDIEGRYDVAWLSHILHGEGPDLAAMIVRKAAAALEPGGLLMIHEFILDDTMDSPLFPALFSLNMLLNTSSGQAYSQEQLSGFLTAAGLEDVRRLDFRGPTDSAIVTATRPARD